MTFSATKVACAFRQVAIICIYSKFNSYCCVMFEFSEVISCHLAQSGPGLDRCLVVMTLKNYRLGQLRYKKTDSLDLVRIIRAVAFNTVNVGQEWTFPPNLGSKQSLSSSPSNTCHHHHRRWHKIFRSRRSGRIPVPPRHHREHKLLLTSHTFVHPSDPSISQPY